MRAMLSMWPRSVEILLGVWLGFGTWLLGAPLAMCLHDGVAGLVACGIAVRSMRRPERLVNLWNLALGTWLCVVSLMLARSVHSAAAQNELLVGLTLAMFSIIPTRCMQVPEAWRRFFAEHPDAATDEAQAVLKEAHGPRRQEATTASSP